MGNLRMVRLAVALGFGVVPAACDSTGPTGPFVWGSDQALLTVEGSRATLQVLDAGGCYGSFGEFDQPLSSGSFDHPGTYTQLMGVFPGSVQYDAQFSGTITGQRISLTVTIPALQRTIGPFSLVYGVSEEWQACLYP
jgi:hypothetical protein